MKWAVDYKLYYKDGLCRDGRSSCPTREAAFEWMSIAMKNEDFLLVRIFFGPKMVREWVKSLR